MLHTRMTTLAGLLGGGGRGGRGVVVGGHLFLFFLKKSFLVSS